MYAHKEQQFTYSFGFGDGHGWCLYDFFLGFEKILQIKN